VSVAEVLAANVVSPKYFAVMECGPAARAEMETEACFALSVVLPMTFAPSKNWTVPVGVPVAVTVAVKVTDCPVVDGFAEELTAVLVAWPVAFTVCVSAAEVLPRKAASPRYLAVIECEPAASTEVENVAWPALSVAVPMTLAPSNNWTVPVGVPVPVTVAVKVTACPAVDGFAEDVTAVLVALPFTVWVSAAEVLTANVASPRYLAVIECEPATSAEVENVA
jgi:hypothetical protein